MARKRVKIWSQPDYDSAREYDNSFKFKVALNLVNYY
ncbi:hypothetical protein J2S01_002519 [Pectinatus haikarae]|uniref:Transposase n=1 Tax=Pectinatus haikarae TaxID=349096 RepID=A0ABT9YAC3_9FIRM|nr:hypothetical protein [Pectinatus haikarae]